MSGRRVLVFGGTGHVGQAVLRRLARADVSVDFTWHSNEEAGEALAAELMWCC